MAASVRHSAVMMQVPDIGRTLEWYSSIGFKEVARNQDDGVVNWGLVSLGKADLMLSMHGKAGAHDVTLWFYTDKVDELYQLLKSRQLKAAQAVLSGAGAGAGVEFVQHIYNPFYGGREFGIRDLNGYVLYFRQPPEW
jgi:hypothetical protein